MTTKQPAVAVAAEEAIGRKQVHTLSTGVRVRINPVSATLLDRVQAKVQDPRPPEVFIDEKGRTELNYSDPDYIRAVERANTERVIASMDALVLFGLDLVDGLPKDDKWKQNLILLSRIGELDLSGLDLDDALDAEFAYKRYIAMGAVDIALVAAHSGLGEADIQAAEATFRSQEE